MKEASLAEDGGLTLNPLLTTLSNDPNDPAMLRRRARFMAQQKEGGSSSRASTFSSLFKKRRTPNLSKANVMLVYSETMEASSLAMEAAATARAAGTAKGVNKTTEDAEGTSGSGSDGGRVQKSSYILAKAFGRLSRSPRACHARAWCRPLRANPHFTSAKIKIKRSR